MPTSALQSPARLFFVVALSLALAACGTTTRPVICDAPGTSNSTCTCGSGNTAACPVNPGPEFLYATGAGEILGFSIDRNTGVLTALNSVPGPTMSLGLAAVNNQFLYASDTFNLPNPQLDGFSIDQTSGALTALAGSPFPTGTFSVPVGLASPTGSSALYAADAGTVDAFTVSGTGAPTAISGSPFASGANPFLAVDPSGKFLYTSVDDPPGGIFAFTIDSTGALAAVPGSPFTIPGQAVPNSQPSGIVDTGSFVYAALSDTNQVAAFSIVSGTGALVPVPNSPFPAGASPLTLVFANGFLYVANALDGTTSGYSVDSSSGVLTPLSGSPFAIMGLSLATDSLGEYLYSGGHAIIQAFKIDSSSGALTPVAGSPFAASEALSLAVVQIPPP